MLLAIHHRSGSFSERRISYCTDNRIGFEVVDAFDKDFINNLHTFDVFMWHYHHASFEDVISANKILSALEQSGKKVFPNFNTGWHFDDKVAQKYLLEAIGAPLVPSYVFYDKEEALQWANTTSYPKVFKLKGGAGSANVKLVKTYKEAKRLINKAFGKGFAQYDRFGAFKERLRKVKEGKAGLLEIPKGIGRLFVTTEFAKQQPPERGYAYFQDFIPNNDSDIRVIIIDNKAFAVKRLVRENDFRASGSGRIIFDPSAIDRRCIEIAFSVNKKISAQSIGFDFVFNTKDEPEIVEFCYGFSPEPYDLCPGYWDSELNWHEGKFNPQEWILSNLGSL